ncbi:MAG: histidine phosphatase family protein [Paracoccaceae bacterium]
MCRVSNRKLFFITHAEVMIDPDVEVTAWGLTDRGRARHMAFAGDPDLKNVAWVVSSAEQKAIDGAIITANALSVPHHIMDALHENDRSATGYLPKDEFEKVADQFFAHPSQSIRGWERAVDAQARVVAALKAATEISADGDIIVVAHGGVGALFLCWLLDEPISRTFDQPGAGGGNVLTASIPDWTLTEGWRDIAPL